MTMVRYEMPQNWIKYDPIALVEELTNARAAVLSLTKIPYQRAWAEKLQDIQLKREVAGTSRIEGADFTERELEVALKETNEELLTRSQKQARAAKYTYKWIGALPDDRPIDKDLILEVHRRIVTGADDDHCKPGELRHTDENVNFGIPRHRGAEGGKECEEAVDKLVDAIQTDYRGHDKLIQALTIHYHFAAIHPFLDGNGRTARALEAFALQKAGLKDLLFVSMSNYYYDEKQKYLQTLSETRQQDHNLTPFLLFGLKGIALQCNRLLNEISTQVAKALYKNTMYHLFNRLENKRKRVIVERQIEILKLLLEVDEIEFSELMVKIFGLYSSLTKGPYAFTRDLSGLLYLEAIQIRTEEKKVFVALNLHWPTQITETTFFQKIEEMPKAKTYPFL